MDILRRTLLKGVGASAVLLAALAAGMLKPGRVLAAAKNNDAFEARDLTAAMQAIEASSADESRDLVLKVPDIAENGALVPVEIASNIPNTTSIAILVEKNPNPLAAYFELGDGAMPEISLRLKLAQTSIVKVVVKADGKFYVTQREIKVLVGGCDE